MTRIADAIDHPVTGERMVFLQTGAETAGALLQIEMTVQPGGFAAEEHVHPGQDERFLIERGEITLRIAGTQRTLRAGEQATAPAGTPHVWWNSGTEELHAVLEFRPAGRFAEFITGFFALGKAGKTNRRGMPNLLQTAIMLHEYDDVLHLAAPPLPVQKAVLGVLAPLARWRGYSANPVNTLGEAQADGMGAAAVPRGSGRRGTVRIAEILLVAAVLVAGAAKALLPIPVLAGHLPWVADMPDGAIRVISLLEIAAGIALLLPRVMAVPPQLVPVAATGLAALMSFAAVFHSLRGELSSIPFPLVLAAMAAFVGWDGLERTRGPR
jgi:quercetin dioxygenase-like cupin family protein